MLRRVTTEPALDLTITFEGEPVAARTGQSVAEALLEAGVRTLRTTPVSGAERAPYCMMGVCFDCLVSVDGQPNQQACMVTVAEGMQVARQQGAADPLAFETHGRETAR